MSLGDNMSDAELVASKLPEIELYVRELRTQADLERLLDDVKDERFVAYTLQLAVQAALDVASHIASSHRLGEPQSNEELFVLLGGEDWFDAYLEADLRSLARFRDLLVHAYTQVDLGVVQDIVRHHLLDLDGFVKAVRSRLSAMPR